MFYVLCTSIHQHIEPTVVCTEFVTWIVVLLFMPKDSHFAGIRTAYRKRQRNLGEAFFVVSRTFASRIHEISDLKKGSRAQS